MKSFLLREKSPTVRWSLIPDNIFFEGEVPSGFQLAISPSENYIILDVDRHGEIDGFDNIPLCIRAELEKSLNYTTKNNGKHYWLKSTSIKLLRNKASGLGFDLRTNRGYAVWYLKGDVRSHLHEINETSTKLNNFLELHFS